MKKASLIFVFSLLCSCGEVEKLVDNESRASHSFSLQEKRDLFPNPLFQALVDKEDPVILKSIMDQNSQYLFDVNIHGDTPLGVALKFYNPEGALTIAKQLNPEHYLTTNHQGESYIYLAAQRGYVDFIKFIANRFYESETDAIVFDYEFRDLDLTTHQGERAIHVAKNYVTADALSYEYWRGILEYPFREFQYLQNNKEQSFLHTAVRDQNTDLIRWGLEQHCMNQIEWKQKKFYYRYPNILWRGIQKYGQVIKIDWDNLINTQDQNGLTPINFSAKTMFLDGIRLFSECQWVNYKLPDDKGNIPLQNFLLTLDKTQSQSTQDVRDAFVSLMEKRTRLTWLGIADHVNHINNKGESSLHIAAQLADSYFYQVLKKYGQIEQENHQGQTPKMIFENTRNKLESL